MSNYQEGTSKIIKSGFISFSEQKKEITNIDPNNPKILGRNINHQLGRQGGDEEAEQNEFQQPVQEDFLAEVQVAKEEASRLGYEEGYQLGYQEGYDQGKSKGYQEGLTEAHQVSKEELRIKTEELDLSFQRNKKELIDELTQYKKDLEPKVALIIERLVKKLVGIQEVNSEIILFLIRNGLEEVESYGDLIIRVSSFDIDYVQSNRARIIDELSESIQVEILKDANLSKNDCIIETDMGTIDSSLGTQMERLLHELRLIYQSFRVE